MRIVLQAAMLLLLSTSCEPAPKGNPYDSDSNNTEENTPDDGSTDDNNTENDNTSSITSIAELKSLYKGSTTRITTSGSISGTVVANDIRGEFSDEIVVDDGYDAIRIAIDNAPLFGSYPIGCKVTCNCQDLYIGSDYGVLYLGAESTDSDQVVSPIGGEQLRKLTLTGEATAPIPTTVAIDELTNKMVSRFIRLEQIRFEQSGKNFCDVDPESGRNLHTTHSLTDRYNNKSTLYIPPTVEYADIKTPDGWIEMNVILEPKVGGHYRVRPTDYVIF